MGADRAISCDAASSAWPASTIEMDGDAATRGRRAGAAAGITTSAEHEAQSAARANRRDIAGRAAILL